MAETAQPARRSRRKQVEKLLVAIVFVFTVCILRTLSSSQIGFLFISTFEDETWKTMEGVAFDVEEPINNEEEVDVMKQSNNDIKTDTDVLLEKSPPMDRRSSSSKSQKEEPLNIVLIYPDDWRYDSIGSEKPYVQTPFLDQLAKEGIRFTQNAVTTSICWMSRATLFSGQYSSRHKSYKLSCPEFTKRENWKYSWPSLLREAGYYIGHVGKWQYFSNAKKDFDWSYFFERHHWEKYNGERVHAADVAKIEAIKFFDERPKDKPFALEIMFYPPKPIGDMREPGAQFQPTNG